MAQLCNDKRITYLCYFLVFAALVFIEGFRNETVGTDTINYVNHFLASTYTVESILANPLDDPFSYFLFVICYNIYPNYCLPFTGAAILIVSCFMYSIYKMSSLPFISYLIYISFGIYYFPFNGLRQGMAIALFVIAYQYILEKKTYHYLFLTLLAALFHKSVLLVLPIYFIINTRVHFLVKILMYIFFCFFIYKYFFMLTSHVSSVFTDYSYYSAIRANEERLGEKTLYICSLISIILVTLRFFLNDKNLRAYSVMTEMFVFGTGTYICAFFLGSINGGTRLMLYFMPTLLFLVPIIIENYYNVHQRVILKFFVFVLSFLLFFITFYDYEYQLNPIITSLF